MSADAWLQHVTQAQPHARALYLSETRAEFLDAAERLIERVVQRMEAARSTYRKLEERDLSRLVVELLGPLVPATAEADSNGHVDVTIRHPRHGGMHHLTECKIWRRVEWHREGMRQLLRYCGGREERAMCLVFFVHHKRMVFLLGRLREDLATGDPPPLGPVEDHPVVHGAFVTRHEHASGSSLALVHLGCHLWEEGDEAVVDEG